MSVPNEIIIGDNFYRILKSFSTIVNSYNFVNHINYQITENNTYSLYNVRRKNTFGFNNIEVRDTNSSDEQQLGSSLGNLNINNKRIILVDDDPDILFTYESFLKDNGYEITSFTNPSNALNFIKDLQNFNDLLVTLDIRMKDLNGFQLQQQIKSIDPTIKILFITVLDISDEILTIIPGLSKEQILIKPVDRKVLINTVKKLLN